MMGLGFMAMVGLEIFLDWVVEEYRYLCFCFQIIKSFLVLSVPFYFLEIDLEQIDKRNVNWKKLCVIPCFVFKLH